MQLQSPLSRERGQLREDQKKGKQLSCRRREELEKRCAATQLPDPLAATGALETNEILR